MQVYAELTTKTKNFNLTLLELVFFAKSTLYLKTALRRIVFPEDGELE